MRLLALAVLGLVATTAQAHASWQLGQSRHFVVYSDDRPDAVRDLATRLERFDKAIRVALKLPDPDIGPTARVTVFVVASLDEIGRITGATEGYDLYRAQALAGPIAFLPRRRPNDQTRRTASPLMIVQRGYARHVLLSSWDNGAMPPWLTTGLAEFFATAQARADGGVILGGLPEYRWESIDQANVFPIERLVRTGPDYADAQAADVFCGRSWLLIHYLTFDRDRAKQLDAYIAALRSGRSADDAAAILGTGLDGKLNAYGQRPMWSSAALSPAQIPIGAVTVRALGAGEAAVMPALMRSRGGVDAARALDVLAQARALAAPFPGDAAAQNELALAAFDAGDYASSLAAADRALAADPGSVETMIRKGAALAAIAKTPADRAAARRWLLAANKADPLYFYPVQLYYASFVAAREVPSPVARQALLHAFALNPANVTVRWDAAQILLGDGNATAARAALGPIAFGPDGGRLAEPARTALKKLDPGPLNR